MRWMSGNVRSSISLGVPEQRLQQVQKKMQFLRTIEEAYYKDVLVFAAAHNEHPLTRSYPASFGPALLSVDKHHFADPLQFAYFLNDQIEFQAHSQGYFGPFRRNRRQAGRPHTSPASRPAFCHCGRT